MNIDRSHFLVFTAAIAAGGAGGWVLRDQDVLGALDTRGPVELATRGEPVAPAEALPPPAPTCDDSVGTVEACPAMGPAAEGVCSNIAAKRCAEFKVAFKPKVAENAVACIRRLKGAELCDANRANLCGHTALMVACQEPDATAARTGEPGAPATPPSPVVTACETVVKGCGGTPLTPTMSDCRHTLSGMNDLGRASMVSCMAAHCGDRGLLGCEALADQPHTG